MHRRLLPVALAAALSLAGAGCSGSESSNETVAASTSTQDVHTTTAAAPPVGFDARIRVVDGDSAKPVRGASVKVAGRPHRTSLRGVVRLRIGKRKELRVTVSAPSYGSRVVRVNFRKRLHQSVPIWRPALQWPLYGATPARTQAHPAITLRPPFRVVWKQRLRSLLEFPAVVWEGVAYVNNFRGYVTALSMRNGRILWRRQIETTIASSPAVDPRRRNLVVTSKVPGRISLVRMDTGKVRWRYDTAAAESSPVIANGIVYFGDKAGRMYALDLRRRKPRWVFSGGVKITSSPALRGRRLYFGDYSGRVFALDVRSGRRLWTGSAGSRVYGTVAVADNRVFAPSVFSGLSALSARTGALLWRIPVGVYLYSSPAYYRGRVYFGTYAGLVYCADARSGRILWRRSIRGRVSGAIIIVAGVVYAGSLEGEIKGWHWRTGRTKWTFPHGKYVPVSGNGVRLLMHGRSGLYAVEPKRRR